MEGLENLSSRRVESSECNLCDEKDRNLWPVLLDLQGQRTALNPPSPACDPTDVGVSSPDS